jgi:hypothetical protein
MRIELFKLDLQHLVEFSISASDENYKICSSDSYFMDERLFYLFQSCFEASSKLFDYYEPTKYDLRNIVPLLNQLRNLEKEIGSVDSSGSFNEFLQNRSMGNQFLKHLEKEDTEWKKNWSGHVKKLTAVCRELISLADTCFNEDKVLWVKGN